MVPLRDIPQPNGDQAADADMSTGTRQTAAESETSDTSPIVNLLSVQQQALTARIATVNNAGSIDGLFAFHVVGNEPQFPFAWDVNCGTEEWLAANSQRLNHFPVLAATGYTLRHFTATAPSTLPTVFDEGLAKLRQRDPFPEDRISFTYQPVAFLGLALGTIALGESGTNHRAWLAGVLADRRRGEPTPYHTVIYAYIRYELTGERMVIDDLRRYTDVDTLAVLEWGVRQGAIRVIDPLADLSKLQAKTLRAAVTADVAALDPPRAAIVWSAIHASLVRSVGELVLSRDHVAAILRRFEDAMRRWRWDDPEKLKRPIRWPIISEREVQDLVWLILRSVFDDVVDEETLPKLGHSTYRADFGIPSLRLLVEVKFARQAADFKAFEKEVMEDAVAYLLQAAGRYERLLVFIYDHSSSVQEHGVTAAALHKLPQIQDVIIVSRPSQLPAHLEMASGPASP